MFMLTNCVYCMFAYSMYKYVSLNVFLRVFPILVNSLWCSFALKQQDKHCVGSVGTRISIVHADDIS